MDDLILLNKPMNMLSQFTSEGEKRGLSDILSAPEYRVAGRLDSDSEGLLVLTSHGQLQAYLTSPKHKTWKYYYVQVEGLIDVLAIGQLAAGICLKDGPTKPARVQAIEPPDVWERSPPVRYRAKVPTSWIEVGLQEGRNRQIRRMTAHVGYPTLRLIRHKAGPFELGGLLPGQYRRVRVPAPLMRLAESKPRLPPNQRKPVKPTRGA